MTSKIHSEIQWPLEKFEDFLDLFTFILIACDKTIGIYVHAHLGLKS